MQPRELPPKWRGLSSEYMAKALAAKEKRAAVQAYMLGQSDGVMLCASELEAALAEEGDGATWAEVCGEVYQVVSALAAHAGVFEHPDVQRALDRLIGHAIDGELLPWPREDLGIKLAEADDGWLPLADAPLGVPLELWGREPTLQGVHPYEGGGWSLRMTLDATWSHDPRPIFASHGLTHARLVTPPPCAREGDDG